MRKRRRSTKECAWAKGLRRGQLIPGGDSKHKRYLGVCGSNSCGAPIPVKKRDIHSRFKRCKECRGPTGIRMGTRRRSRVGNGRGGGKPGRYRHLRAA